ncbi:hypothetical protein [Streptosporangium sp. NPDC002524]|uniref:hypothetical protein n=1 Tax=Streptosporangium sp. NPDC002524 TaxID=3154537 RepID=UPI00331E5410
MSARSCPAWCRSSHETPGEHLGTVGRPVDSTHGLMTVALQQAGRDEPTIRVVLGAEGSRLVTLNEALALLIEESRPAFAAALVDAWTLINKEAAV